MARISGSTRCARAALAATLLACAATGCLPGEQRDGPPTLYLNPSSALQGTSLVVHMSAEGVAFDACELFEPAAVTFVGPGGPNQVTVYLVEAVSPDRLRVQIAVDLEAAVGQYAVSYSCDSNTVLEGVFQVRSAAADPVLTLDPDQGPAGSYDFPIKLSAQNAMFVEGVSHVVFGDGTDVAVKDQIVLPDGSMDVVVDITGATPLGEMAVAVVTGAQVARGAFTVTERIYPKIQVEPDEVVRPAPGEPGEQHSLVIEGEGVSFVEPADLDAGEIEGTQVGFPGNPGITVDAVAVADTDRLEVNITVDELAKLGAWPLEVRTGDEVAVTDFTVLAAAGNPVLLLSPPELPRGIESALLLAQVINFSFDEPLTVGFTDPECHVDSFEVLPSSSEAKSMAIYASVDADFAGTGTVLQIDSGGEIVAAHLAISDDLGPVLGTPSPPGIVQGNTSYLVLTIQGDVFETSASAEVLTRSGLRILWQNPTVDGLSMTLQIEVAPDAPVGPALIRVSNGDDTLETFVEVLPSGAVPYLDLSPEVVLPGRRTVTMQLAAAGLDLQDGPLRVRFDDPAVGLAGIDHLDGGVAALTVTVGPTARSDMTVAYVETDAGCAAATYRGLRAERPRATATPELISRPTAEETASFVIQVAGEGTSFGETVAQVLDDIALEVERVTVIDEQNLEIELEIGQGGPGGWFGILLKTGAEQVVVPLEIEGDDTSLTLELVPFTLHPGAEGAVVDVFGPAEGQLDELMTTAGSGLESTHATLVELLSSTEARLLVDLAHDAEFPLGGIPLFLTASKGALVGFLQGDSWDTETLTEDEPWTGTLASGETRLFAIDAIDAPALVTFSASEPGSADLEVELLAGDRVAVAAGADAGVLWLTDSPGMLAASPAGDPADQPSTVALDVKGAAMLELGEPDDLPELALELSGDPCGEPFLAVGEIAGALDLDRLELATTACRLVAVTLARELAPHAWSTPDAWLELRDLDETVLDGSLGWPSATAGDPRLYFTPDSVARQLVIGAQLGTAGLYLVNIRRPSTIREVCRVVDEAFIELELEPGANVDDLTIELLDADGVVLESRSLAGLTAINDGAIVIAAAALDDADLVDNVAVFPDDAPFALRLLEGVTPVDAVQIGDSTHGEGDPLLDDTVDCFSRLGGIDSDDNRFDFVGNWRPTPGY